MAHTFNSGTLGGRGSRISEFKDSQNYKRNLVLKIKIMLSIKLPKVVVHVFNLNTGKCEENNCDWYLLHSRKMCSKNMENSITNTPSVVIHADWYGQDGTEVQYGYKDETSIYTTISILKMRLCLPQNCFFFYQYDCYTHLIFLSVLKGKIKIPRKNIILLCLCYWLLCKFTRLHLLNICIISTIALDSQPMYTDALGY